jgi:hypothetical protein
MKKTFSLVSQAHSLLLLLLQKKKLYYYFYYYTFQPTLTFSLSALSLKKKKSYHHHHHHHYYLLTYFAPHTKSHFRYRGPHLYNVRKKRIHHDPILLNFSDDILSQNALSPFNSQAEHIDLKLNHWTERKK